MKKMTLKSVLVWVVVIWMAPVMNSCSLEDEPVAFHFLNLRIVNVEMPESFDIYQSYPIKVTYIKPSNCTYFEGFDFTKDQPTTISVVAVGSALDNASCAPVEAEVVEYFTFTCNYHDAYTFRFWTGEDGDGNAQFLEYDVPVNPSANMGIKY